MTDQNLDREKLRLDHELGRYGLLGTFYGAMGALFAVVIIAIAQIVSGRNVVEGWSFTALVGIIMVPVIAYGAFAFNRFVSMEAEYKYPAFTTRTAVENKPPASP